MIVMTIYLFLFVVSMISLVAVLITRVVMKNNHWYSRALNVPLESFIEGGKIK